ncbi:MAG: tetratricopeptide repeat protein [Candidatus Omnitrophota bacterium]
MKTTAFQLYFPGLTREVLYRMGLELYNKGFFEDSAAWFEQATRIRGKYTEFLPAAYIHLGEIAERKNDGDGYPYFQKALALLKNRKTKTHVEIYRLASLYQRLGKRADAYRWFNKLIAGFPLYTLLGGAYFHLGELYLADRESTRAREMFDQCLAVLPGHGKAREYLIALEEEHLNANKENES